jgi:hypothetical protein
MHAVVGCPERSQTSKDMRRSGCISCLQNSRKRTRVKAGLDFGLELEIHT